MGRRGRHCRDVGGAIVCGGSATPADRAEVEKLRRYLAGEMAPAERLAFTGLDGGAPTDAGRLARVVEIHNGGGTVREARVASGLSLGQTARLTGWARERVTALELGAEPTPAEREVLCELFDVRGFSTDATVSGETEVSRG